MLLSDFAASVGGFFASTCCLTARLRDKDDFWNAAAGGAAAGSLFGLRGESCEQLLLGVAVYIRIHGLYD